MKLTDALIEEGTNKLESYAKNSGSRKKIDSWEFNLLVVQRSSFLMWYEKMQQQKYDVSRFAHKRELVRGYRRIL